ncbi:MAG: hypothetical protein HRT99_03385 [Mycoplasmatales bacterium]|nr:hypothetical protein [Mycoplasmatales bacterium]
MRHLEVREAFIKEQNISNYTYELKYGSVRADIVEKRNKIIITYEIKAEGDSFFRLKKQLDNYSDFSNRIFIIIPKSKFNSTLKWLKKNNYKNIGIYAYFQIEPKNQLL